MRAENRVLRLMVAFQIVTALTKIVENHHGRAWLKIQQVQQLVVGGGAGRPQGGARPPAGPNVGVAERGAAERAAGTASILGECPDG
jgi:hypothetical protein